MQILLLVVAILAVTASAYDEILCKTTAKDFQMAHRVISKKLKVEVILATICKESKEGCGDTTGLVRAIKNIAAQRVFCDVTDPENLNEKYKVLLPGVHNSTKSTLQGYFDDDDIDHPSRDDHFCKYDCGRDCDEIVFDDCISKCHDPVNACADIYDPHNIPACIDGAKECLEALGGKCCACPCYYELYCCQECEGYYDPHHHDDDHHHHHG